MFKTLVECVARFENLAPVGYAWAGIRWVVEVGPDPAQAALKEFGRGDLEMFVPRAEKSGKVSETNLKPALLVDKARYALGVTMTGTIERESDEHKSFIQLVQEAASSTGDLETLRIAAFLQHHWARQPGELETQVREKVKPNHLVAFRTSAAGYPFGRAELQKFWRDFLRRQYSGERGQCVVCGRQEPILRILPWQVTLFPGYDCPISSFNEKAFWSFGKEQTTNSPLCFDCASGASMALQHLAGSDRHSRILAQDKHKGTGKAPLRNQRAVFWLKELPELPGGNSELNFDWEAVLAGPLTEDALGAPPETSQMHVLYGLPFRADAIGMQIARNRFYVAVLSPNKSRLVLREWIDVSLDGVCRALKGYDDARTMISADGRSVDRIPVQELLKALRPWKSRASADDGNIVRGLVRTAYTGVPPPPDLLYKAVQRFRVPVRPKKDEIEEFDKWRQAQAAAIKLVLTYGTEEATTLQHLNIEGRSRPHLCGQLLATLEEAQLRAARWRINATLVDRFYGGASTSPSITLGWLLKQATQAHMPKVRKAGLGYEALEQVLERIQQELYIRA